MCFRLGFVFQILALGVCENRASVVFFGLGLLFQNPIYSLKVCSATLSFQKVFLVLSVRFSTALYVPSGFSNKCFETAPDLSFSKHVNLVLAKRQLTSNQSVRLAN